MPDNTAMQKAKTIIDALHAANKSWRDVAGHIAKLPPEAGALIRTLQRPEFAANVAAYAAASNAAVAAQARHKSHARRAGTFGFLAALVAGIMLYFGLSAKSGGIGPWVAIFQVGLLAIAFYSAFVITFRKPYRSWAVQRGAAESNRIQQFQMLLTASEPAQPGELALSPLALEYARAYLMDDQRNWYDVNQKKFSTEVSKRFRGHLLAAALLTLAALPAIAAIITGQPVRTFLPTALVDISVQFSSLIDGNLFVLLGLVGGALQTLVTCLAASSLADRNAATYGRMTQVLDALSGEPLEGARVAAANGDQLTLERFWTKLSFELIGEQREWSAALKTAQLLTLDKLADVPFANND